MKRNGARHLELSQAEPCASDDDENDVSTTMVPPTNENGTRHTGLTSIGGVSNGSRHQVSSDQEVGEVLCTRTGCQVLFLGQALSFLLASGGAAQATLHLQCNLSAPTFTSSIIYFILSFHLIPLYKRGRRIQYNETCREEDGITRNDDDSSRRRYSLCGILPLEASPWAYLCIAFLDVQANYMTVLAYRYTTITSITLFDALAIPSAMILSFVFLGRRYTAIHYCGVIVCMTGVVYNVLADYETNVHSTSGSKEYPHKVLGDVLAVSGGILYGANDFLAETCVRRLGGPTEFLAMIGLFGLLISILQAAVLERDEIVAFFQGGAATCSVTSGLTLLLAYAVTNSLSYVGASRFLLLSEAAFLNLSFLTGDFWSLGFSIVAERIVPSPLFFVALTLTLSGVIIYEMGPSTIVEEDVVKYENVNREAELTDVSNDGTTT